MSRVHDIDELPWSTQGVVLRWLGGEDVMAMMSKTTRYRHRRIIMNELGVDIAISAKEQEQIVDHLKLDGKYLKEHEVKSLPQLILQGLIYKPEPQLAFGVC